MSNRNPIVRSVGYCLSAALLFAVATSPNALAASPDVPPGLAKKTPPGVPPGQAKSKPPLVLETTGVFWVGGEFVDRTEPTLPGEKTLIGDAYVEYFIPQNQKKNAVPIVITHSSLSGVVFQTKGDGGEGWVQYFARQGYPVYVVDPPGVGRAGFDVDMVNAAATGRIPPLASPPLNRGSSESWVRWNTGPAFGELGAGTPGGPGNQMPTDEENLRRFLAAQLPLGPSPVPPPIVGGSEATVASLIAVLEKTGPAIYIGWSGGGTLGGKLVDRRPDLFKALISLEAGIPSCSTTGVVDPTLVAKLVDNNISFLNVNSTVGHSSRNLAADNRLVCQALIDQINAAGGDATQVQSPDFGIIGNSHMMFWENGSDQLAQIVVDWMDDHVK